MILEWHECLKRMQYEDPELYERCVGVGPSHGCFPYYFNQLVEMARKCGGLIIDEADRHRAEVNR